MFDAKEGKRVFESAYDGVLTARDPEVWYAGGYSVWACWESAASDAIDGFDCESVTDLMAYVLDLEDAHTAFSDGFTYLLGQMMEEKYEEERE